MKCQHGLFLFAIHRMEDPMKRSLAVGVIGILALSAAAIWAYIPYQERKIVASIDEQEMMRANIIMILELIFRSRERREPTEREKDFILDYLDNNPDFCTFSYDVGIYGDWFTNFMNFIDGKRNAAIRCYFEEIMTCSENRDLSTFSIFQNTGRLLEFTYSLRAPCQLIMEDTANGQ